MKLPWSKKEPKILSSKQIYNLTLLLNVWVTPAAINRMAWHSLKSSSTSQRYVKIWLWSNDLTEPELIEQPHTYWYTLEKLILDNKLVPKDYLDAAVKKSIELIAERVDYAKLNGVGIDFINSVDANSNIVVYREKPYDS